MIKLSPEIIDKYPDILYTHTLTAESESIEEIILIKYAEKIRFL